MSPPQYSSGDDIANDIGQELSLFKSLSLHRLKKADKFMVEEIPAEVQGENDYSKIEALNSEYTSAQLLEHPNIIKYCGIYIHTYYIYNIIPLYSTPLTAVKFHNRDRSLSIDSVIQFIAQMASALVYLHSPYKVSAQHINTFCLPCVHGGLSVDTIVFDNASSKYIIMDLVPMLRKLREESGEQYIARRYYSPEKLLRVDDSPGTPQDDMWSLGVILYEITTNQKFSRPDKRSRHIEEQWVECIEKHINLVQHDWLRSLIKQLLAFDPAKRLTAEELLMNSRIAPIAEDHEIRFVSTEDISLYGKKKLQEIIPEVFQRYKELKVKIDQLTSEINDEKKKQSELEEQYVTMMDQQKELYERQTATETCHQEVKDMLNNFDLQYNNLTPELEKLNGYLNIDSDGNNMLNVIYNAEEQILEQLEAVDQSEGLIQEYEDCRVFIENPDTMKQQYKIMLIDLKTTFYSNFQFIYYFTNRSVDDVTDDNVPLCSVCMGNVPNVIIYPCKHIACCNHCLVRIQGNNNTCPYCRSRINDFKNVNWL